MDAGGEARTSLQARFGQIGHAQRPEQQGSVRLAEAKTRTIRTVNAFSEFYEMGKEVMPSTHSYMKVNFAVRKSDGLESVVKLRFKPNCFRSREDERTWRANTEFLLNLPGNPGIARLYEVFEDPKAFYVVMEKVQGQDLFETLESAGKLPVEATRDILFQLLCSLVHLHTSGAVHKDLKLENVMCDMVPNMKPVAVSAKSVKVIDFDTVEEWVPTSPASRDVVGTDQYIAQEAYAGKYSPLSDMFAVGVIAYRLLTGRFPFHDAVFDDEAGENWVGSPKMAEIRQKLRHAKVDFSHQVFHQNPLALDLVQRLLAYTEGSRPTAAAAIEHSWFTEAPVSQEAPSYSTIRQQGLLDDGIIICEEPGRR